MWSQLLLCCLVGFALASNNPAWKDNTEYSYKVRGRTLSGFNDYADQFVGTLLKAHLTVQPKSNGNLYAKISDVQIGEIHTELAEGWNTQIPDSQVAYKPLPMSGKPFEIVMQNGVIRDLIVSSQIGNAEANMIKSIVSQFQLDTKAENLIPSHINALPEGQRNDGVFKTMEDTITGQTETLYEIHPLPRYVAENQPWLVPQKQLIGDGQIIEIVKNKNFTNSQERPVYYYGLGGMRDWEPATNQMGQGFSRSSVSRIVVTGQLSHYTVQNSHTVSKVVVSPTGTEQQKTMLVSSLNVTLSEVRQQQQQPQEIASPVKLGNLVYRFNKLASDEVRGQHIRQELRQEDSYEQNYVAHPRLFRRSISQELRAQEESQQFQHNIEQYWAEQQQQEEPTMEKAPHTPLMPYTMGYKGKSVKQADNFNVAEKIEKLAKEIGQYVQQPETMTEQQVLSRFVTLVRLMRISDFEDLKQISQTLYTKEREGAKAGAWIAFRDATAQAGTGPCFLLIKDWIQTDKITGQEAATIVSTMARNVHTPTLEYITKFFELVKSQKVQSQDELKDTCALSLGHLLNRVLVSKRFSHNEYPAHTFGRFATVESKQYMRQTIIPYFRQQLQQAVQQGNSHDILLCIRVLGNIADRDILAVFEPYLEGQQQVSQFQRFFMIVALNQLVQSHPELARSVLYKVYQNRAEEREVRLISIFYIMKTSPSNDMLQRMAMDTQTEQDEFVAAAIKSAIQQGAKLQGDEYKNFRSSAQSAEPLLTKKTFGWRHAENYLRNHVARELQTAYKSVMQVIPSEGSYIPKYMGISLRSNVAGLKRHLLNVQAMVTGVNQLLEVLEGQTENYKTQQQYSEKAEQNQWSSQHIAKLLKLNVDQKEQLEGLLSMDLGSLQIFKHIDNKTIERLPERIQHWQQELQQGKQIHHLKFMDVQDFQMAFPTEMGLPFVYSYNKPLLIRVHGKVEAQAQPELVQGGKLHAPKTIKAKTELKATFVAKELGHVLSVNTFDHEAYVAAYDKAIQVHIPIRADVTIDVEKMEVQAEIEPLNQDKPMFYYRSMPYTCKADLLKTEPLFLRPTTKLISHKLQQGSDEVYGKKQTGMAFRVQLQHEQQRNNLMWLVNLLQHEQDVVYALGQISRINKIENTHLKIEYLPEQSTNRKVIVKFGYQQEYRSQAQDQSNESQSQDVKYLAQTAQDSQGRQQDFMKKTGAGINNAFIRAFDCKVEFQGQQTVQYILTGALGKSNVDPKSRVLFRFRKESNIPENKQFEVLLSAVNEIPNTNGLDLTTSMTTEPKINTQVKLAFGQNIQEKPVEIEAEIKLRRSESRKQYLTELPLYQECKRQMQEGNHQLDACEQMTIQANYLNDIEIHAQHKNVHHDVIRKVENFFNGLRHTIAYMPYIEIKEHQGQDNKVQVHTRFAPNLRAVNVTVKAGQEETTIYNVKVNDWMQTVAVPHPVFHLQSRVFGRFLGNQNIRKTCVVDQTKAHTFANQSYSVKDLPQQWTVMMQYVPERAHQQQQTGEQLLKHQTENYVVLVRASQQSQQQKEVKITFNNKQTDGQVYDITMKPSQSGQKAKVYVNEQEVKISDRQSHDIQKGLVQIYALPNGEVKIEVRDNFYVIYDGQRAKLTLRASKFRGQVRGLCGQDNEHKYTDFLTADNCIVGEVRDFIRSYNVEQPQQQQQRQHCARKHVQYVNVVSKQDANRGLETKYGQSNTMGTTYQTRYIEKDGEICFTRREYPVCRFGAPRGTVTKNVSVHCVQKTAVANLWKDQIDNGQNPSFSGKAESKQLPLTVPQGCSQ